MRPQALLFQGRLRRLPTLLSLTLASIFLTVGCGDGCGCNDEPKDWTYQSEIAPYQLKLSKFWIKQPKGTFNNFAELSLERGPLNLVIFSQKVAVEDGYLPITASELGEETIAQIKETVPDLTPEDRVKTFVGTDEAFTQFATGRLDDEDTAYLITSFVNQGFGYRIICWGPPDYRDAMTQALSKLLSNWNFKQESPSSDGPKGADKTNSEDSKAS